MPRVSSKKKATPDNGNDEPQHLTSFSDLIDHKDKLTDETEQQGKEAQQESGGLDAATAHGRTKSNKKKNAKKTKATEESTAAQAKEGRHIQEISEGHQAGLEIEESTTKPKAKKKKDTTKSKKPKKTEGVEATFTAEQATSPPTEDSATALAQGDIKTPPRPSTPLKETHPTGELPPKTPKFDPNIHGAEIEHRDVYGAEEETTFISPKKAVLPIGLPSSAPAPAAATHVPSIVPDRGSTSTTPTNETPITPTKSQNISGPVTPSEPIPPENDSQPISQAEAPPEAEIEPSEPIEGPTVRRMAEDPSVHIHSHVSSAKELMSASVRPTEQTAQTEEVKDNQNAEVSDNNGPTFAMPITEKKKAAPITATRKLTSASHARRVSTSQPLAKAAAGKETKKLTALGSKPSALKEANQSAVKPETNTPKNTASNAVRVLAAKEKSKITTAAAAKKTVAPRTTSVKTSDAKGEGPSVKDVKDNKSKGPTTIKARSYGNLKTEKDNAVTGPPTDPASAHVKRVRSVPTSPKTKHQRTASGSSKGSNAPLVRPRVVSTTLTPHTAPVKSSKPPTIPVGFRMPGEELAKKQAAAREAREEKRKKQQEEEKTSKTVKMAKKPVLKPAKKPPQEGGIEGHTADGQIAKGAAVLQKAGPNNHLPKPPLLKSSPLPGLQGNKLHRASGLKPAVGSTASGSTPPSKVDTAKVDATKAAAEKARALAKQKGIESVKAWEQRKLGSKPNAAINVKQDDKATSSNQLTEEKEPVTMPTIVSTQAEEAPQ